MHLQKPSVPKLELWNGVLLALKIADVVVDIARKLLGYVHSNLRVRSADRLHP